VEPGSLHLDDEPYFVIRNQCRSDGQLSRKQTCNSFVFCQHWQRPAVRYSEVIHLDENTPNLCCGRTPPGRGHKGGTPTIRSSGFPPRNAPNSIRRPWGVLPD